MKRVFGIIIIFISSVSCSLDIPVEDEITGLDVIDNIDIANETLSGIYNSYPKDKVMFSKLADDFYPNHTISENTFDFNLYRWETNELIVWAASLWQDYYHSISRANVLLNQIASIQTTNSKEEEILDFIHAQTLALKAFSYLDLTQLYAPRYSYLTREQDGIILKDNIASEEKSRATMEASYREIERLLLRAIELFPPETTTKYRFSKNSAKALLARVYLHWNKYEKAIVLCDELLKRNINQESYASLWRSPDNSEETLLVFDNEEFNYASLFDNISGEYEYYIHFSITYGINDYRKDINLLEDDFRKLDNSVIRADFLGKYRNSLVDETPKPIVGIRLAELHFIKSEALYKLSREEESREALNSFLSLRNASPVTTTGSIFLQDLLREKQKEFLGEGIRYFDLKRNRLLLERVDFNDHAIIDQISTDDFRWVFPIPENEIRQNKRVQQNPEWEKLI
ncbi:RagB/SusD family nutrient uptake outer membrane protein [Aquimarina sp. TRL1]|uniref:RagB/SusD family nutrient uptake outer membrane protein n=1 Tax=Aquimarina sp. (strain TRL1) TaxID=2736252 RepID=UPI00158B958D|nr:RagB/SusD family nutrient uptake outer membrane protein [Aquimarina sp. TRL1]QKX07405.1 RagB/SusD family nutrient uptake outer membrane protein [Aquimarina sp. TRL1]